MASFIHLHTHSEYSLLDGLAKISDLLSKAKEYGMDALALTDHGAMYGSFKFYLKAKDAGIKPIIGLETYLAQRSRFDKQAKIDSDQYHLVLLAKNYRGYENLMKLTTIAHLEGFYYKPRIDKEVLKEHSEGLICLSGCIEGEIAKLIRDGKTSNIEERINEYLEIFGREDFYFELQKHPKIADQDLVNQALVDLSKRYGIPLVATNDIHYVNADDAEAQEILLCIQTQRTIYDKKRPLSMIESPDFYMRSPEEMKGLFLQYPESIENTLAIAKKCNVEIPLGKWIVPPFKTPDNEQPDKYLYRITMEQVHKRYSKVTKKIKDRLEYELSIISKKDFSTYYLIVADFVNWAKNQGIAVGPGRGSVAGSLIANILRITDLDPLEYNLPFERFLNLDRPSPPDFDLDFADDRRDEVIDYVSNKYGKANVAQIITFGTMEARQSIRDVGRVLGMPYSQPDRIAKMIPPGAQGFPMTIEKALSQSSELNLAYRSEPETAKLLDLARKLEGVSRHASVHAAGVVMSDKPLVSYTPLQKEARGEKVITQYDMYCLDLNSAGEGRAIGLLKMDFLGLRNLTILQNAIEFVKKTKKINIDLTKIPLDNKSVYNLISSGETTGVFQLESSGMRRLARDLQPSKFSDIAAMVALFRPGPMEWITDFTHAKKNPRLIKYPHKDLKPILEETYGIAVYQEQCMQIASRMAGYTLAEADRFRRAIGKKKPELMKKEKDKFIKGCLKQGYSSSVAEKVFSLIERFVGYGFNKPHSASYAMIAYQTAYMKVHYTVEFMTAILTAESRATSGPIREQKLMRIIEECRRMNIKLLPPEINESKVEFTIEFKGKEKTEGQIRFGLSAIKNVGQAAIETILLARKEKPFSSLTDFCKRVDLSKVNRRTLESLIKSGAFDKFGKRAALLSEFSNIISKVQKEKKSKITAQDSLFKDFFKSINEDDCLPNFEEFTKAEILNFEKQYLGFYLTEHPARQLLEKIVSKVDCSLMDLSTKTPGRRVRIGGIITRVKKINTRRSNAQMAFVTISDLSGGVTEIIVFPKVFELTGAIWIRDSVILAHGRIDEKDNDITFIVESAELVE